MANSAIDRSEDFKSLHLLTETGTTAHFRADVDLPGGRAIEVTRGDMQPFVPTRAQWFMGRSAPAEIVWTSLGSALLIHDRVVALLQERQFGGWRTYDVALTGRVGEVIDGYHGLIIDGRCGTFDDIHSPATRPRVPRGGVPRLSGWYLDPASWDGSHLFMPSDNVGFIFVVEAVKQAFLKAKIKNVAFKALELWRPDGLGDDPSR